VICGGDGSIQEGINAVLSEAVPDVVVGLAPAGTCNDFAFALGVKPVPTQIVDVLLYGVAKPVDLGRAGNRYFCTIATLGFESAVNRCLRDYVTRSPSRWLFVATACAMLMMYAPIRAQVTINGSTRNLAILNLMAANTPFYGGHILIAPSANPGDGQIDIVMFQATPKIHRFLLLPRALAGRHLRRPGVTCERATRVTIETDQPQEVWADGEPIGTTPIDFTIVPNALRILVPRNDPIR
jgi:YegS/Rv2252/BmrU family lipid kinase